MSNEVIVKKDDGSYIFVDNKYVRIKDLFKMSEDNIQNILSSHSEDMFYIYLEYYKYKSLENKWDLMATEKKQDITRKEAEITIQLKLDNPKITEKYINSIIATNSDIINLVEDYKNCKRKVLDYQYKKDKYNALCKSFEQKKDCMISFSSNIKAYKQEMERQINFIEKSV